MSKKLSNTSSDRLAGRNNSSTLSRSGSGDSVNITCNKTKLSGPTSSELTLLWTKLKKSECPYVENLDEWSLNEVLKPCDLRISILQWILSCFGVDEKFLLQPTMTLGCNSNEIDFRYQNIIKACSSLGLAEKQDGDLIMGKVAPSRQVKFFCFLLDLVIEKALANEMHQCACSTPIRSPAVDPLTDIHAAHNLIDTLLNAGVITEFKKLSFKLPDDKCLPKELQHDKNSKTSSTESLKSSRLPPQYEKIQGEVKQLNDQLQQQENTLRSLQEMVSHPPYKEDDAFLVLETLRQETQVLHDATIAFNNTFENDLKIWCCSTSPDPSSLDPLTAQLHDKIGDLQQFCENLNTTRTAFKKITTDLKAKLMVLLEKNDNGITDSFRKNLPDWIEILQEAINLDDNSDPTN